MEEITIDQIDDLRHELGSRIIARAGEHLEEVVALRLARRAEVAMATDLLLAKRRGGTLDVRGDQHRLADGRIE